MLQEIINYISVFGLSMFKFVLGPAMGQKYDLQFYETFLLTVFGMMASVYLFTSVLGDKIHHWIKNTFYKNQRLFSKRNRRAVKIWRSYGLLGIAFLTPVLFSPIGGAIIANSFGEHREKIFLYMLLSAIFWAPIFILAAGEVENLFSLLK